MIPRNRSECIDGPRPCPHVRCRYHLVEDLHPNATGRRGVETCALDLADRGGMTGDAIAAELGVTPQRVRQIIGAALRKLPADYVEDLRDIVAEREQRKRLPIYREVVRA